MQKGLVVLLGLAAAISVLVVAIVVVTGAGGRTPRVQPPRMASVGSQTTAAEAPSIPAEATYVDNESTQRKQSVAHSMDLSNIRSCVTNLKLAAATDDAALRRSMLTTLRRYGDTPAPLIREALSGSEAADNPKVRAALEEALAQAR